MSGNGNRSSNENKRSIRDTTAGILEGPRNYVLKNWPRYILLKNLFALLALPIIFGLAFIAGIASLVSFVVFVLLLIICLSLDGQRMTILESDPEAFVKGEKVESAFNLLMNGISICAIVFMYSLIPLVIVLRENNKNAFLPSPFLQVFIGLVFLVTSVLIPPSITMFESSYLTNEIRKAHPSWRIPEYFVPRKLRARARFLVTSNISASSPDKLALGKFVSFKEGVEMYNNLLKAKFGIALRDGERFTQAAKLKFFFGGEEGSNCIRKCLTGLVDLMNREEVEPFEFVRILKAMMNEPTTNEEICKEICDEGNLLKKWFSKNRELIEFIVAPVISAIIAGIILYLLTR